jgi:hypothetical protein
MVNRDSTVEMEVCFMRAAENLLTLILVYYLSVRR